MKNTYEASPVYLPIVDGWGQEFANDWLSAWNSKDLDKIVGFYADQVTMISPTVTELTGLQEGITLQKSDIKELYSKLFIQIPELHYSLVAVAVGIDTLTIHYTSCQCDMVADVIKFDDCWRVTKSHTYY
ncbi:nuclear transport factor 2 family protein [Limnohabitans sp.]|uniref:nuclear transport factor 2 family protein n=1 Tax=Limnohabitans sp. TaxID=1907725 RepID=UPI00286EDB02|nr:nuclear transport factor 2 family protein [Limnohabitans sp.]